MLDEGAIDSRHVRHSLPPGGFRDLQALWVDVVRLGFARGQNARPDFKRRHCLISPHAAICTSSTNQPRTEAAYLTDASPPRTLARIASISSGVMGPQIIFTHRRHSA